MRKFFIVGCFYVFRFFLNRILWSAYNKKAYLHIDFNTNQYVVTSEKNLNFSMIPFLKHVFLIFICVLALILLILLKRRFKIIKNALLNTLLLFVVELFFAYLIVRVINLLSKKSSDELHLILSRLLRAVFDFKNINTKLFFVVNVISILVIVLLMVCKKNCDLILRSFIFTNSFCIFYLLELYVLYAIIMNREESIEISAFDRYFSTYIIILYLIQLLSVIHTICHMQIKKYFRSVFCSLIVAVSFVCIQSNIGKLVSKPVEKKFPRHYYIHQICKDLKINRDEKVVVYVSDIASRIGGYFYYLCSYELLTTMCTIFDNENINEIDVIDRISSEKYLIIAKDNKEFWNSLSKYNISVDDYDGQVYSISKEKDKVCFNKI